MKVQRSDIEHRISKTTYLVLGTVTICHIELDNGFSVRGESACVDPNEFNKRLGETLAHTDAFNKLWAFFGFLLADKLYHAKKTLGQRANEFGKSLMGESGVATGTDTARDPESNSRY